MNDVGEFVNLVNHLSPEQFIGLARVLNVKTLTQNVDKETHKAIPRPANEVYADCLNAYADLGRIKRRRFLRILQKEAGEL